MTEASGSPALLAGRRVSLLPRSGGQSRVGTVQAWDAVDEHVTVRVAADPGCVSALDKHQVWLSPLRRVDQESGITIFAGRARAVGDVTLEVEGVVRLVDERRRQAVRATGCLVTLPPAGGPKRTVGTLDLSRGGVRLPVGLGGWTYDDPIELTIHLDTSTIIATGRLLRVDIEAKSVVLVFDKLEEEDAEAIDRYAIAKLERRNA
jgi:hypothetical protein